MYVKEVTYTDYSGTQRTEKFYFNLSQAELMDLEYSIDGGFYAASVKAQENKDAKKMYELYKTLILKSYGQRSEDGRRFIKSEAAAIEFTQTEAYSQIFMELLTDENTISEFIKAAVPNGAEALKSVQSGQNGNASSAESIKIATAVDTVE